MSEPKRQSPGVKAPDSMRIAQIAVGVITLVLAGIVLAFPGFAVFLIAIWLSISLLFGGIEGVLVGAGARHLTKGGRAVSIGVGAAAIGLSVAVLAFPTAAALTLVLLLSIALLFLGAGAISRGVSEKRMPNWSKVALVAVGTITVGLSIPVMIFPAFGFSVMYAIIAAALIINGGLYIMAGATGAVFSPIGLRAPARRSWESDAA